MATTSLRRSARTLAAAVSAVALLCAAVGYAATQPAQATSGASPYDVPLVTDTNADPGIVETTIVADETTVAIGNGITANALTFNGTIPGPEFRLMLGQRVIVHFENHLDSEATGIHWHGIELSNPNDGTPLTQNQVPPGGTFVYDFVVSRPGVYWYHPHHEFSTNHVFKGLYGSIIVADPNQAALVADGTLPSAADTRTLVLGDITVCKAEGANDAATYDPALPWVGGGPLPVQQPPTPTTLCDTPLDNHGDPLGSPLGAGDVPNIQRHAGRVNEGQTVLTNGVNVGGRAGSPEAPGALAGGASALDVQPGQGLRLQLVNTATTRFFRLRLTDAGGNDLPLVRVGGEGGLLNEAILEGTPPGGFDFKYEEGEILLDPGDRADVVVAVPATASGVATLWTEDFQRTGGGDLADGWTRTPTVPVAHFNVTGAPVAPAYAIGDGTALRAATSDPVEVLPAATGSLVDPATLPTPQLGSASEDIQFTANGATPAIDGVVGSHDFAVDYTALPFHESTRWALLGDTLELTVTNTTPANHPFHLHGFSIQPLSYSGCDGPVASVTFAPEYADNFDVPPSCTLTFRVRLDDRLFPDGSPGGGVGRWVIHCHIFFHHHQGMETELVVIDPESLKIPTTTEYAGDTSGLEGQPATMAGVLLDADDDTPIAGETLTFELEGAGSCDAVTDGTGLASCVVVPTGPRGPRAVDITYAGSDVYQVSGDTASFYVIVPISTGRAVAVDGTVPLVGTVSLADTGPVASETPVTVTQTLASMTGLLTVKAADSSVQTEQGTSLAASTAGTVAVGVPLLLPAIQATGVSASSSSACASPSSGAATITSLRIGGIPVNTAVAAQPNSRIKVLGLAVVLNEQIPFTTADGHGLTVNAVHITGPGVDLRLASATSDVHECTAPVAKRAAPSSAKVAETATPRLASSRPAATRSLVCKL